MSEEQTDKPAGGRQAFNVKRLWPIAVLITGFVSFKLFGLDAYFSFDVIRENRAWLLDQVANNSATAAVVFILTYMTAVTFSLPGGAVLTIVCGFLFGQVLGVAYAVFAATIGATALFLIVKTTIGDALKARMGPWMKKMEKGLQENAFSYLLVLRLIPIFPFFVVNLVPSFFGVRLSTYFLTTLFGIIPGTVVYVQIGAGLGSIFESGRAFTLAGALTTDVILALIGLALLSLLPILYKRLMGRNKS